MRICVSQFAFLEPLEFFLSGFLACLIGLLTIDIGTMDRGTL